MRAARSTTTRRLLAGACVLLLSLATLTAPPTSQAVPGVPGSAFDPPQVGWSSHRNQSSSQFHDTFLDLRDEYLPLDLEIDTPGYEVGSVWQRNLDGRAWKIKRNLTSSEYAAYWKARRAEGYRVVEQENYVIGGVRYWAGIWVDNTEDLVWISKRGMTAGELDDQMDGARAERLMPVDIDEYNTASGRRYSAVWVASGVRDWRFHRDLTKQQWADTFDVNADDGYRVLSFESVRIGGWQRYSGVYVTNDNGRGWFFRRDMSNKGYTNWWYRYRDLGYRVVGVDRYETDDGTRYAGMWRQNNDRPDWFMRSRVDDLVEAELDDDQAPGIAVAIYVDGQARYLRGFGDADEDGHWMDSSHIGSIASVSKAVAGVLTFRMRELGEVDLDDETEDLVPAMPNHHTHTVGQLVSNRGCVRHYKEGLDTGMVDEDWDTARDAAEEFWDGSLWCNPVTQDIDHYSTHGYTLLGAALEAAGGDDVKGLVRNRLVNAFSLGTLGPQRSSGHLMGLHDDGDWIDGFDNDWKVLGGGIDSSVADLAAFGAKLANGTILPDADADEMWTPPTAASGYAFGWGTGMVSGQRVVAKNGSWAGTRAYLRIYPDQDISVAVIMNDRSGGAEGLGQAIGDLVLSTLPS